MTTREQLERHERLLRHVHTLNYLKFFEKNANSVGYGASGSRQRLHHVGERSTRVIHEIVVLRVAAHALQQERHGLFDGKTGERVLVAHDEQLTQLGERGELHRLVGLLQRGDELLHVCVHARGHGAVEKLLHFRAERVHDVRG